MKFQKLFLSAVAACLLLGASSANAVEFLGWKVVGVESTSFDNYDVDSTTCVGAMKEMWDNRYFLHSRGLVDDDKNISYFLFARNRRGQREFVALYCAPAAAPP